ncbi:MAG: 50S ribosomal protein L19 [Holosporales bacterium]|jgi:large subunit ribosomal protein L19|nr:50S ribosomal protein L19 [Holosporales bacterium]
MNLIAGIDRENIEKATAGNKIPAFRPGDQVSISVKISEGANTRRQAFDGVVIAKKNRGINSSFKVRKISNGEGVERLFHLYSPNIQISVIKHGRVRRAKLYYLRGRTGKSARIAEKRRAED